jgi:hypothetical protein
MEYFALFDTLRLLTAQDTGNKFEPGNSRHSSPTGSDLNLEYRKREKETPVLLSLL